MSVLFSLAQGHISKINKIANLTIQFFFIGRCGDMDMKITA